MTSNDFLSVRVRNVGPIHRADLVLSPLTIFIGPNNTGKSVAATILHVAARSRFPDRIRNSGSTNRRRYILSPIADLLDYEPPSPDALGVLLDELLAPHAECSSLGETSTSLLQELTSNVLRVYGHQLLDELQTALGSEITDIVRMHGGRRMPARIEIESPRPSWCITISLAKAGPRVEVNVKIDVDQLLESLRSSLRMWFPRPSRQRLQLPPEEVHFLQSQLQEVLASALFVSYPHASFYLPAARSGILQSHRTLAAALVRSSTRAGIEEMMVPRVSGLIADFISEILEIRPKRPSSKFALQ